MTSPETSKAYAFLASEPTLQVLSPELVRPAQRVTAQAQPSGVVYALVFAPYPTDPQGSVIWTDALIAGQLAEWAGNWNWNANIRNVLSISPTQEVDASGALKDVAVTVVQSTSGKSTAQTTVPVTSWVPPSFSYWVDPIIAQLDAAEATG